MADPSPEAATLDFATEDRLPFAPLAPGSALGNFRVVRELGAGGMGIVFEAYDPALDRLVAIKVVRDRDAGPAASARLMREAQAMARLAHPNVVQVHDVDAIDGQFCIVMELVRGETLEAWLTRPRSWREIVRAFVQAGDGLAAIHRAGLVHRDFKPSNVLVDEAGHVRVGDFGIARDDDGEPASPRLAGGSDGARPVGTPAYMAPEQRDGVDVDARADQYAFARSLERALAGEVALAGVPPGAATVTTTGASGAAGERAPAAAIGRMPRRLRAVIARATRVDRDGRFPAIDDVVRELRVALDARRRAVMVASVGLAAAAIAVAVFAWASRPAADDCDAGARLVDTVWNPGAHDALAAHFASVRPNARFAPVAQVLDDWAGAWRLGRRSACRAEPTRRAARVACLDRDLTELRVQLSVAGRADGPAVDGALAAAMALPDPALCANQLVGASTPHAVELHARIADVSAAQRGGRGKSVVAKLPALIQDAGDDAALLAPALYAAGFVELALGDLAPAREHMVRAAREAGRAGDDDTLLKALIAQASIAELLGRPQDALGLLDAVEALVARAQLDRADKIAMVRGDALSQAGRHPEAIAELERAVAGYERKAAAGPAGQRELAAALGALASAYRLSFHYAEARKILLRVEPIETELLGPDHPELAGTLHDLAVDEARLGELDAAEAHHHRARAIFVRAYGERSLSVVMVDMSLASLALQRGNLDDAKQRYEQLLDQVKDVLPPDHVYVAIIDSSLGAIERDRDRCDLALPHFARAIALLESAGHTGADLAIQLTNVAGCYDDLDRYTDARAPVERALEILERAETPLAERSEAMAILADVEAGTGNRRRAIELATQIIDLCAGETRPAVEPLCRYASEQRAKWSK